MTARLIDTNVLLRHLLGDHPAHSPAATQLIRDIEQGAVTAWTTSLAIAEVVFVLTSKRTYNLSRTFVRQNLLPIIELPNLGLAHKQLYKRVFDIYVSYPKLSYVDAYEAARVEQGSPAELYSFDTDFDALTTVTRIEPPQPT
jgi:predicted nucleic acid-binding protein